MRGNAGTDDSSIIIVIITNRTEHSKHGNWTNPRNQRKQGKGGSTTTIAISTTTAENHIIRGDSNGKDHSTNLIKGDNSSRTTNGSKKHTRWRHQNSDNNSNDNGHNYEKTTQ